MGSPIDLFSSGFEISIIYPLIELVLNLSVNNLNKIAKGLMLYLLKTEKILLGYCLLKNYTDN